MVEHIVIDSPEHGSDTAKSLSKSEIARLSQDRNRR